jgi:hypothetical protein
VALAIVLVACSGRNVMVMPPADAGHDAGAHGGGRSDGGTMGTGDRCTLGESQGCYTGDPAQAGVGACALGMQTCMGDGERATWGDCLGSVMPSAETCNGVDDDCNGVVDEGLSQACSNTCGMTGTQVCSNGSFGACSAMSCVPCIQTPSLTAWQINLGEAPTCWPQTFSTHGDIGEYQYSTIPPEDDPGWAPHSSPNISFNDPSALCIPDGGQVCACLAGGDFTYFQTSFDVAAGFNVTGLTVTIADVDDGARVSIFNSSNPNGMSGGYAFLGGGSTSDFAQYVVQGKNRIVLTHVDDCCGQRRISNATITLNGSALNPCP